MYPKVCCLMALLLLATVTYSQQTYPNTLLWRISGKGLTRPSYLFGTIHLTDKRLFRFGDSVYHAIEKTDGLAIELNPDELVAYIINNAMDQVEGKKLKEFLNEKDYKKYSAVLEKKFHKPASHITTNDIVLEKNKWLNDYLQKGEMPTFMDAWLYNVARRKGKWVGGVEDMADQTGLLNDVVDKSDIDYLVAEDSTNAPTSGFRIYDRMISLYLSQNLLGIDSLTNATESPEHKNTLLTKRNVKMARRIDSLTGKRSMFIAVGAAHLPGDSGVIHLLQKNGFTVEPVFSSKKINADDYSIKEVHEPWVQVEDASQFYKISMPGNPTTVKLFGLIDLKCYLNIFNLSFYFTTAAFNPGSVNKDSVINRIARKLFGTDAIESKKVFSNGVEGKEFGHWYLGMYTRVQAFVYDNVVYLVYMFSNRKEKVVSADANNFFSSFAINKKRPVVSDSYKFTDSVMGVSFISPAKIIYNNKLSSDKDEAWHISGFTGTDNATGSYVMLFSRDVKPAHFITSDTVIFSQVKEMLTKQYTGIESEEIQMPGCTGIRFKGRSIVQPNLYMNGISLIKYNRNIMLLAIGDSASLQSAQSQQMFTSFHFIESPVVKWNTYSSPDSTISAWLPGEFRILKRERSYNLFAFDTTTASSYCIFYDTLSRYVWFNHDSAFWNQRLPRYISKYTIEKQTDIQNNSLQGKELLLRKGMMYKRVQIVLHGNEIYELLVTGDKELVLNNNANAFFNSFRIKSPSRHKNYLTESKAVLLLNDLGNNDSVVRKQAYVHLNLAPFSKSDIALLKEALSKQYLSPYKQEASDEINKRIADILNKLNNSDRKQ